MADMIRPEDIRRIISDSDRRQPGQAREPEPLTRRTAVDGPRVSEPSFRDREPPLEAPEDEALEDAPRKDAISKDAISKGAISKDAISKDRPPTRPGGWIEPPKIRRPQRDQGGWAPARPLEEDDGDELEEARGPDVGAYDGPPLGVPDEPAVAEVAEEEAPARPRRRLLFPLLIALAALLGFAAVLLYGLQGEGPRPGLEAPTLRAQVEVDKVKPSEPGGLQVPNRDVKVLDQSADRGEPEAVVLQPPPEEPAPLPPVPQPVEEAAPGEDQIAAVIEESETRGGLDGTAPTESRLAAPGLAIPPRPRGKLEGREEAIAAALASGAASAPPAAAAETQPEPSQAAQPEAPAAAPAETETAATGASLPAGSYLIQLASLTSAAAAEGSWKTMTARHSAQLSGLAHSVQKTEIEGRGTFYRLRAGPFPDRDAAQARCEALKEKGQACIVVAP